MRASTSYPYGLTQGGVSRAIRYEYSYDRLGRISHVVANKGFSAPSALVRYEYYPTGAVRRVTLGNDAIAIDYTYHISGAVKTAVATNLADNSTLFSEALYYEDCGSNGCMPQYNGNISRVVQSLAHGNANYKEARDVMYAYDFMNRLAGVDDHEQDEFDEYFKYDAQGRITSQRRGANARNNWGGEYSYYAKTNKLEKVANGMGGESANNRNMSASGNFVYDSEGNLIEDKSKDLKISYDWRGMPVEFVHDAKDPKDAYKLLMAYDGSGRRISKTRYAKHDQFGYWTRNVVTHYTGIGTEVRELIRRSASPKTTVVMNLPQGLGRYMPEDAVDGLNGVSGSQLAGYRPPAKFEWYLKNHIGSTMLVYGTSAYSDPLNSGYKGGVMAAYDYRAFGEQVSLAEPTDKVTENFTGKEKDDETELNYFGARYLDPMLGLWISVDPERQFFNSYAYGPANPINGYDFNGKIWKSIGEPYYSNVAANVLFNGTAILEKGSSVMRKTTLAPNIDNTQDIRVRNVVQEWRYDPKASNEENARHNYGARRIIQQVKVDKAMEINDFMKRRNETTTPLYNTQEKMGWMPFVFDEEPLEMNDFPVNENAYEPNGNVEAGDILECDNCSL